MFKIRDHKHATFNTTYEIRLRLISIIWSITAWIGLYLRANCTTLRRKLRPGFILSAVVERGKLDMFPVCKHCIKWLLMADWSKRTALTN